MTPEAKAQRVELLEKLGLEVHEELISQHVKDGGDRYEIVFHPERLPALVETYETYLETFRQQHISPGNLVDGDKIAAFTGTLIMRYWLFESETNQASTVSAEFANETFAIRAAQLFTRRATFGFVEADHIWLTYCFGQCFNHDPCMQTWSVAAMAQQLRNYCKNDKKYSD